MQIERMATIKEDKDKMNKNTHKRILKGQNVAHNMTTNNNKTKYQKETREN